jgi:hypothetical protein
MTASLRRCRDRLVVRLWWRTWTGRIPTAARAGNAVWYGAQAGVRDRGYDLRRKRMRLRGLSGARDEFHLAAIVQNLKTLANPRWSRILESAIWLRTNSRSSGSAISSGVTPTRLRRGATGTPALLRRAIARRERPPCAIGIEAKSRSEFRAEAVPLLILEPPAAAIVTPWLRRTNVWRRVTSPARGAKRLRSVKSGNRADPMGADHRIVPAIKQALSMLGQAREALLFAQCPAAVAKVRRAIKSTEGALGTAKRRVQSAQVVRSVAHPMAQLPCLLATNGKR